MSEQAMAAAPKTYCEHRCMREDGHDGGHWYGYVLRSAEVPILDRLARALFESGNGLPEGWDDLTEDVRDYWRAYADIAIRTLSDVDLSDASVTGVI